MRVSDTTTTAEREYTFGHSQAETERLKNQADDVNTFTRHMLEDAGLTAGMKVLDVGSGAGDVALLAARMVGPLGTVVGVDVNPDILASARQRAALAGLDNVSFVTGDVDTLALDTDFDAVIGRLVLSYVPDMVPVLRRLSAHVKPGGIVAFQEVEMGPSMSYLALPGQSEWAAQRWQWAEEAFRATGMNTSAGFGLFRAFQEAGLGVPRSSFHVSVGGDRDWSGFENMAGVFRSLLPVAEKLGIFTLEEIGPETLDPHCWWEEQERSRVPLWNTTSVTAWVRKPL
jgi:SAM-dependent methyltransferase